ncbi:hypothetical protein ABZ079_05770 [Streptomyces sp. NPDC006314]|uniref:hypothetical protein n=1 Tax=Streptomyces sp. NPDC006314 TaxID=3154475 RepID=UPI0033BB2C95
MVRLHVVHAVVVDGWDPYESEPKTDGSANTIALDSMNIAVLRDHKARQAKERADWGGAWQDAGKVFTKEDGSCSTPRRSRRPSAASSLGKLIPRSRPAAAEPSASAPGRSAGHGHIRSRIAHARA